MKKQIIYEGKEYAIQYHPDLIGQIANDNNTFFEEWLLTPLKNKVRSFDFVVDVGSNMGNHAFFFKEICNGKRVVCFEPHPDNFKLLQENCPTCENYNMAISSENTNGFIQAISLSDNSGVARLSSDGFPTEIKTLDSFGFENVTFIKIDVEGFEIEVLQGAQQTLNTHRPDVMVEVHTGIDFQAVEALMPPQYVWEKVSFESHYLFTPTK